MAAVAAIIAAPAAQRAKPPSAEDGEGFDAALAEAASRNAPPEKQANAASDANAGGPAAMRASAAPSPAKRNAGEGVRASNAKGAHAREGAKRANARSSANSDAGSNGVAGGTAGLRNAGGAKDGDAVPAKIPNSGKERAEKAPADAAAAARDDANGPAPAPVAAAEAVVFPTVDVTAPGASRAITAPPIGAEVKIQPLASGAANAAPGVDFGASAPPPAANAAQSGNAPAPVNARPTIGIQTPAAAQPQTAIASPGHAQASQIAQANAGQTAIAAKAFNGTQAANAARAAMTVPSSPPSGTGPKVEAARSVPPQGQTVRVGRAAAASALLRQAAAKPAAQSAGSPSVASGAAVDRGASPSPKPTAFGSGTKTPALDKASQPSAAVDPAKVPGKTAEQEEVSIAIRIAPAPAKSTANGEEPQAPRSRDASKNGSDVAAELSDPHVEGSDAPQAANGRNAQPKDDAQSGDADVREAGSAASQGASDPASASPRQDPSAAQAVQQVQHSATQPQTVQQAQGQAIAAAPAPAAAPASAPAPVAVMPQASGGDAQSRAEVPAIAAAVTARALSGLRTFEIRLDPPELGRVEVHLTVGDDGRAEARLTADHPATLALLARDSQHLERALKDAGLQLSNNSLNFSLKGEGRQGDGGGGLMGRARSLPVATVAKSEAALVSAIGVRTAQGNARLDIRV